MSARIRTALIALAGLAAAAGAARAADYVAIVKTVEVDRPAELVWARVGDYCAIGTWMKTDCAYTSGTGGPGTVRKILKGATLEVEVARTPGSYTYFQTQGGMAAASYHGTLAVEAEGPHRSRLTYTLVYDQGAFPDDQVRAAQHTRLDGRFQGFLEVMKAIAEAP